MSTVVSSRTCGALSAARVLQEASKAGPMERQSRSLPWQAGETSAGQGERMVFLTTPCITLEAFVETKVRNIGLQY